VLDFQLNVAIVIQSLQVIMQFLLRVFACLLLAGNVVSLSTNFMQSDVLSSGKGEQLFKFSADPTQTFKTGIHAEVSQWLSQLRGAPSNTSVNLADLHKASFARQAATHSNTFMSSQLLSKMPITRVIAVSFVVVISCLACAALVLFVMEEESAPEDQMAAKPPEDLHGMEKCDGTWAVTYQNADATSKEGLELLFRCHIIPTEEFAHSRVSQEHIDECVWIATHMLRQRKLDEWTEMWPEALRTFEESVTACFAARTDVRTTFYDGMPGSGSRPGSPRALQYLDSRGQLPTNFGSQPQSDQLAGSGDVSNKAGKKDMGQSSAAQSGGALQSKSAGSKPDAVLKTAGGRKSLMERCRQIMAASDARRAPMDQSTKSAASAASDSPPRAPQRVPGSTGATETPSRNAAKPPGKQVD